jgi:ethanolamine utilization protein EutP (predicted NTPase)
MGSCSSKETVIRSVTVRIALVGDAVSGKTAILTRFANNEFKSAYKHNTKNFVAIKSYLVNESSTPVTIEIWEIQNNPSLEMDFALVVADITMPISQLQDYYWKWFNTCKEFGWNKVSVVLSKKDMKFPVEPAYADKVHELLALESNQKVFLTSAQQNEGIDVMFKALLSVYRNYNTF